MNALHAVLSRSDARARVRQQEAQVRVAELALGNPRMQELFDAAAVQVADAMDLECGAIFERQGGSMLLRSGQGWPPGVVGNAQLGGPGDPTADWASLAFQETQATSLRSHTLFGQSALLRQHPWRSGATAPIDPVHGWGALAALALAKRPFSGQDQVFLRTMAGLLSAAIERVRQEEELRQRGAELERRLAESLDEIEAFGQAVNHDLRTPLRAVGSFTDLLALRHGSALPSEAHGIIDRIRGGAREMDTAIHDLLAVFRVHAERLELQTVDVSAQAKEILTELSDGGRTCQWTVEPGLTCVGDRRMLRVVLANLLDNAWKFTSRTPMPRIRVERAGQAVCIADNGAGFAMENAGKLFQPFQRLHRPSEFGGTGIGLALVRRIVQRHGGKVWADAEPGRGARFYFALPSGLRRTTA